MWHSYCVRQNNFVTSSTVLGLTEVLSPTGNPPVIPGGHWSHLPGLHQRRVGQWLCNHRAHAESRGLQSFNEDWHAGCARRCLDNGPITAQCLQCAKDNDPSVWVNQMEKKVHLHVRGRKWKVERERLTDGLTWSQVHRVQALKRACVSLCVILYCVSALARAPCHRVCSFVWVCACACVCCSGGLTACTQAWWKCSPTHSAFIRLTDKRTLDTDIRFTVNVEKGVCVCVCKVASIPLFLLPLEFGRGHK